MILEAVLAARLAPPVRLKLGARNSTHFGVCLALVSLLVGREACREPVSDVVQCVVRVLRVLCERCFALWQIVRSAEEC
jgi:hypothetical protein